MAENRDFLAEFNELRAETDGIRKTLVSKTTPNGLLEEIAKELRMIRGEIKENQGKNEKKFEEMKKEVEEQNSKILEEIRKNQKLQDEKMDNISKELAKCVKIIPIREVIAGEWKMVEHANFEGYKAVFVGRSFEDFSANLVFEIRHGCLRESSKTSMYTGVIVEGRENFGGKDLYEEDNHFKSFWGEEDTIDRYIENGKLYYVNQYHGTIWHRVFVRV